MLEVLVKLLQSHPEAAITILQSILDILKADPALMAEIVALIKK